MNWKKIGGISMIVLGLISFVMMIILGWDISLQIAALQRQFFAENWILAINSIVYIFFGVIITGLD